MKALDTPDCKTEILSRIGNLSADSPRRWGKMTAGQMVCHLSDSYLGVIGEKYISPAPANFALGLTKWIALCGPFHWPKGFPTRPEVDQTVGGTTPAEFEEDKRRLLELVERFARKPRDFSFQAHPMFGEMSERDWMRWGYLHADHHLRQFGQ
jgi:hypothetical protein